MSMQLSSQTKHQRKRLLDALASSGPKGITTIQIRHELDIMSPSARIAELRLKFDKNIQTIWSKGVNPNGGEHKVARYVLLAGSYSEHQKRCEEEK